MIYKPFFRDDLGYKPRYTQPLHLEEVVVSPIYSESEDYEKDLGYKPIYHINMEGNESESTLSYTFASKEDFKSTMLPIYEKVLSEKGINPIFAKSLVAQDGLESAWGSKPSGDNNFGGIKGKGRVLKTREVGNGKDVYKDQEFRNFASLEDYAKYKVNLLDGKKYKAFDGGLEDFSRRISAGGYATDPRYKEVLDRVIRSVKKGGILKAQRGVLVNNYNTPGDWYDYSGSSEIPKNGDHWGSRNPDTGLLLKHPNHETYYEMLKAEQRLGNRLFTDLNGREYSFNDFDAMTKGRMPGMKEKSYPSDLWSRDANKLYGSKLDTAVRYYNKLKNLGAEDVQAAAIIGVLMKESSLDHHAVSSNGAKGVAQLLGDKYNDYTQWLSKNKKSDTAENQIEWVWDHMASGKDHWHDYYISLYNHSLNRFSDLYGKEKDTAIKDWSKMKDSKWAEYNYEAFRDDFYNITDPGDAAELFTWTFERPGDDEADIDMRRRYSDSLYEYMTRFYKE